MHSFRSLVLVLTFVFVTQPLFASSDATLSSFERKLKAIGYVTDGKIEDSAEVFKNSNGYSITIWIKPDRSDPLARQIKFFVGHCSFESPLPKDFKEKTQAELKTVYRAITDHESPQILVEDFRLDLKQTKIYQAEHFLRVRLTPRPMYCDSRDGESLELDFFPK